MYLVIFQIGKYVYKTQASRDLGDENTLMKLPLKVEKTTITRSGKEDVELIRFIYNLCLYLIFLHSGNRCSAMSLRYGVVDSTGAGDAYIGGFLAGLLNNYQIQVSKQYTCYISICHIICSLIISACKDLYGAGNIGGNEEIRLVRCSSRVDICP